ncbi:MAG TPA: sialate O-acetylesterase, partial [Ohtaekwangia sp.]|nr:sialate O-acetylesterase [Ohtaekwangia sp.]
MKKLLLVLLLTALVLPAMANVTLPKVFGDNMVLQRGRAIAIWGWASPREKVTVKFNKQQKSVTTGKDGKWRVDLGA